MTGSCGEISSGIGGKVGTLPLRRAFVFHPLPLRERGDEAWSPPLTRRSVKPCPPHPNPLPRGERGPEMTPVRVRVRDPATSFGAGLMTPMPRP